MRSGRPYFISHEGEDYERFTNVTLNFNPLNAKKKSEIYFVLYSFFIFNTSRPKNVFMKSEPKNFC